MRKPRFLDANGPINSEPQQPPAQPDIQPDTAPQTEQPPAQDSEAQQPLRATMPPPDSERRQMYRLTYFRDVHGKTKQEKDLSAQGLKDLILSTDPEPRKEQLPLIKLALFGDVRSTKGSLRHDPNVTGVLGVELDYDAEVIQPQVVVEKLTAASVQSIVYTSPSHVEDKPRFRVLAAFSEMLPPERRKAMAQKLDAVVGTIATADSWKLSQSFFIGHLTGKPPPEVWIIDGEHFIDDVPDAESQPFLDQAERVETKSRVNVKARLKAMVYRGDDDTGIHDTQLSVTASMLNSGHPVDAVVADVLEATKNASGIPANWNWEREEKTIRQMCDDWIEKKEEEDKEREAGVVKMNDTYAVLPIGGKTRVVTFGELEEFPGLKTIVMTQTFGDFAALHNKYRVMITDEDGKRKAIGRGAHWLASRTRRQYDGGMAFMPQHDERVVKNRLNLWIGYGVKPMKPVDGTGESGCQKFLAFMLKVICNGDEAAFDYLRKREAFILQKRRRSEVALGLHSREEGVGKGFYEKTMIRLLGPKHAMQVGNPKHVIGAFNPHLETLLRLVADEALFVDSPTHRNALFGLITEEGLTIEPKGLGVYTAQNFLNVSVLSNANHFLPVSDTARRFFIPTVSAEHKQDFPYFKAIQDELDGGGYEALLYHLLKEVDLADFNVRQIPQTDGLRGQRRLSLSPLDSWWCELLETGTLDGCEPGQPHRAVSNGIDHHDSGLYDQARRIEPRLRTVNSTKLGGFLAEMGCTNSTRVMRRRGWEFPPLLQCRAEWEERFPRWAWRDPGLTEWQEDGTGPDVQ